MLIKPSRGLLRDYEPSDGTFWSTSADPRPAGDHVPDLLAAVARPPLLQHAGLQHGGAAAGHRGLLQAAAAAALPHLQPQCKIL